MRYHVLTLFPALVESVLGESIIGRAQKSGAISLACYNIRDYSHDKHKKTDDTPFGGGVGMVMTPGPIFECMDEVNKRINPVSSKRVIYMSPKGKIFNHEKALELSGYDELVFLAGHYEGVDQRVIDALVDEEISLGDFVVTGGEIPACIVIDAVSRLLPGVLSSAECYEGESVASGLLEYPQYTKPREYRGLEVPEILLSGDHKKIDEWRFLESVKITEQRRPDLISSNPQVKEKIDSFRKKEAKKQARQRKRKAQEEE